VAAKDRRQFPTRAEQSQYRDFGTHSENEYLSVHKTAKTIFARRRPGARCNSPAHRHLRSARHVFGNRFRDPEKFRKNCQKFRNPKPDTTLRANESHSFPARRYASTPARAAAARSHKKFPSASEKLPEF
jgi:hypothetical protein